MTTGFSYYDVLGVDRSASDEEVHAAYRATISKYHPDVNKAPNATRLSEMLNEAYATLRDPQRRSEYDAYLESPSSESSAEASGADAWPLLNCDRCAKMFVHLRVAVFYRVWSILLYTRMIPVGGVLCPHCRSALAWRTALFSAFLGPWGIPWGIFYTIRALYAAVRAGELPRSQNAQLLRHQGAAFASRGHMNEALTNFKRSLGFERVPAVADILSDGTFQGNRELPTTRWSRGQTGAAFACVIPFVIVFSYLAVAGSTGKADSSAPSATTTQSTPHVPTKLSGIMKTCNGSTHASQASVYAACSEAIAAIDDLHARSSTNDDRETFSFTKSAAQLYEANAASELGRKSEAKATWEQGVSTLKYLSANATQPNVRERAQKWLDCAVSGKCK